MNLKDIRKMKNLTINQLSEISGVPVRTIEDIERRGSCKYDTAIKISEVLRVNPYLFSGDYDDLYLGKYSNTDLKYVLNYLFQKMDDENRLAMIDDINTYYNQIHIKAMNQAYRLYEGLVDEVITVKPTWDVIGTD